MSAAAPHLLVVNALTLGVNGGGSVLGALCRAWQAHAPPGWQMRLFVSDAGDLPRAPNIHLIVPDLPKKRWLARLIFDLRSLRQHCAGETVDVLLSMSGADSNLPAARRLVYCHQPLPWVPLNDAIRAEPRIRLRRAAFDLLYRHAIGPRCEVIVQQDWARRVFQTRYGHSNVIVARPLDEVPSLTPAPARPLHTPLRLLFPTGSLAYKNPDVLCQALALNAARSGPAMSLTLTLAGTENAWARAFYARYSHVPGVSFAGTLPRAAMAQAYLDHDVLVFPSLVESWGLPLSEARAAGLPVLAADLPYAHEALRPCARAAFFDPHDAEALADQLTAIARGDPVFHAHDGPDPAAPYAPDWPSLVGMLTR